MHRRHDHRTHFSLLSSDPRKGKVQDWREDPGSLAGPGHQKTLGVKGGRVAVRREEKVRPHVKKCRCFLLVGMARG